MESISIVIPVRDRSRRVLERSVTSAMEAAARVGGAEVIVVDDASIEPVGKLARVTVLTNRRALGVAGSLNRGIAAANGHWVARLDAGDLMRPERLERQLAAIGDSTC